MRYQDIFVPGGLPKYTYNPRTELQLENKISEVKDNLCKLVTVTGQTKSGKTVLARKILPPEETIWIDGGVVSNEEDFWHVIIENLELFQTIEKETSDETGSKFGGKGTAEANFFLAKGTGEISSELEKKRGSSVTTGRTLSSRVAALSGLRRAMVPIVIDDFHYIPRDIQGYIVRALKPLIFDGLPVVIIAIPHRRYDALKVEKEMTGRMSPIQVPSWTIEELAYIPATGFSLLNYEVTDDFKYKLATESIGSPHLMQDFCRGICRAQKIENSENRQAINIPANVMESTFKDVAETIGRPIFEKLARGPRSRTDRIARTLKDGRTVDIYQLVLHALAYIRPGLVSIEYEELRTAIREVSGAQIPQLQEVARVLKHMATIAATDQSSTPVIDFEEEEKKLHITDPFFAFYLRWGELAAENDQGRTDTPEDSALDTRQE
jgi:hypothetical protein